MIVSEKLISTDISKFISEFQKEIDRADTAIHTIHEWLSLTKRLDKVPNVKCAVKSAPGDFLYLSYIIGGHLFLKIQNKTTRFDIKKKNDGEDYYVKNLLLCKRFYDTCMSEDNKDDWPLYLLDTHPPLLRETVIWRLGIC